MVTPGFFQDLQTWQTKGLVKSIHINESKIIVEKKKFDEDGSETDPDTYTWFFDEIKQYRDLVLSELNFIDSFISVNHIVLPTT